MARDFIPEDLQPWVTCITNPKEYIQVCWSKSAKHQGARDYMGGVLDALRWCQVISAETYRQAYPVIYQGGGVICVINFGRRNYKGI